MGILLKLIIILVLVLFLAGQFTRDKAKRARSRQNLTNGLLVVLILMVAFMIINQLR
ncbi:hypothetical protein [Salidesulfovibrio onnuriiensis]|uniref:hypothetical protein n=1 Tax=Salidesulfovibrio onnuriiensis TaxID=2583823 RepID=UPI001650C341|nr:hypothetical protein [Salidesulfovibrio onnuriiensis]